MSSKPRATEPTKAKAASTKAKAAQPAKAAETAEATDTTTQTDVEQPTTVIAAVDPGALTPIDTAPSEDEKASEAEEVDAKDAPLLFVSAGAMRFVANTYQQMRGKEISEAEADKIRQALEKGAPVTISNDKKSVDVSKKLRATHGYGTALKKK